MSVFDNKIIQQLNCDLRLENTIEILKELEFYPSPVQTDFYSLQPQNLPWEGDNNWNSADLVRTFFNGSQYCNKDV